VGGRRGSVMAERKGERRVWGHRQRERKRAEKSISPVTIINLGPHKNYPDLNPL
jgi:hypothetical protein